MDLLWMRLTSVWQKTTTVQITTLKHPLVMSSYHAIVAIFARSITTCRPIPREGPIIKATGFPIVDQVLQGLRLCGHLEYAVEATWKGAQLGSLRPVNERTEARVSPK